MSGGRADLGVLDARVTLPRWALGAAVCLLVVVTHNGLLRSGYLLDDHSIVENNPIVERGDPLEILSTTWWEGSGGPDTQLYRPVTILSFALERKLAGAPAPMLSHGINIALHLLATLLLLLLTERLGAPPLVRTAAVLLFALHPVHVEAVAGLVGRAEILAALFTLLGLWSLSFAGPWVVGGAVVRPTPGRERLAAWGAALALLLALGSKEVGLAALPLMICLELLFRPLPVRRKASARVERAAAFAPLLLAVTLYLMLRVRALETLLSPQRVLPAENPLVALEGVERLATALGLVARYAGLLFYPIRLSADYSGPVIGVEPGLFAFRPLAGLVLLALCLTLAARPLVMRARGETPTTHSALIAFAALLFLLPYLVIGNLFFPVGAVLAERFLYLPSAGFCILLGLLLRSLHRATSEPPRRQRPAWVVLILGFLVLAYGARSWARCLDWRDDESLFHATTLTQPRSPRAHYILGRVLADRGQTERALEHYALATEHDPDLGAAWFETGVLLGQQGRYRRAETAFREALRCVPTLGRAHLNLAIAVRRQGRSQEAELSLRKAVLHAPQLAGAWAELGNLRLEQRRHAEAAEAYRRAMVLGRTDLGPRLHAAERELAEHDDNP